MGYAYSSFIASSLGWQWSFIIEALASIPLTVYFLYVSSQDDTTSNMHNEARSKSPMMVEMNSSSSQAHPLTDWEEENNATSRSNSSTESIEATQPISSLLLLWEEALMLMSNSIFLSLVAGYAAQTATLMGISTFGSAFMMGLGIFETESESSTMFGVLISIAGIIGTPLGGILTDYVTTKRDSTIHGDSVQDGSSSSSSSGSGTTSSKNNICLQNISELIYWSSFVGTILLCLLYFITSKALYLLVVTVGCAFLFLTTSAIAMGTMLTVPKDSRAFSLGVNTVCIHLFGDVPSPIITGYLKDQLASGCSASSTSSRGDGDGGGGDVSSSPACRADEDGLRMTMFIVFAWCFFSVIFFWVAWRISLKRSLLIL